MPVIKRRIHTKCSFTAQLFPTRKCPKLWLLTLRVKGTKQVEISPRSHKGAWVSLGTYAFEKGNWTSSIKIDGCRSKGALFADAIILVPKNKILSL